MRTKSVLLILTILLSLSSAAVMNGCGGGGGGSSVTTPSPPPAGSGNDTTAPSVPANLIVTAVSSNRIELSWNTAIDNIGVTGYRIYRDGTYLKSTTGLTSSDTPLTAGTHYCYKVTAFDASGNESVQSAESCTTTSPAWSGTKLMGTDTYDNAFGGVVDGSGNVYVTGVSYGGLDGNTNSGDYDIILVKYNDSGVKQWTKQLGSSSEDYGYSVAVDSSGNIYVAGYTAGNLDGNTSAGNEDMILIKYNPAGIKLWTRQLGSSNNDEALGVGVDGSGNVYVAGATSGDFDGHTHIGSFDIFLVKYNTDGVKQWSRQMGTAATDEAYALTVDSSGNSYITGLTAGNLDGNTNAGVEDMFLVKYDTAGTKQWTKLLGTSSKDYGYGVAVDGDGNIYVAGTTEGSMDGNTSAGGEDIFLVKYNAAGTLQWIRQMGSSTDDEIWGIAMDASGSIFIVGSTDGPIDGNTNAGSWDMFLVKFNSSGIRQWTRQLGTTDNDEGLAVTVDNVGSVFVTGYSYGNFDGGTNAGENDIFIVKYDTNGVKQ